MAKQMESYQSEIEMRVAALEDRLALWMQKNCDHSYKLDVSITSNKWPSLIYTCLICGKEIIISANINSELKTDNIRVLLDCLNRERKEPMKQYCVSAVTGSTIEEESNG